jgi:hypothetical protein
MGRPKKQEDLPAPGMSRVERPDIEEPAEDLRAITGEIATLNERKRNAQTALLTAMQSVGLTVHKYVDSDGKPRQARIKDKPTVCVERDKSAAASESSTTNDDDDGGVAVS